MNRIRELRKQLDMTQKELAAHLQIANSTLSYWEMGKYEPDSEALMKLSRFFKVPIDYILGGDFKRWDINGDSLQYPSVDEVRSTDSDMSVSESGVTYRKALENENIRTEFDDLTHDEIELLAEYAAFIKSRRKG